MKQFENDFNLDFDTIYISFLKSLFVSLSLSLSIIFHAFYRCCAIDTIQIHWAFKRILFYINFDRHQIFKNEFRMFSCKKIKCPLVRKCSFIRHKKIVFVDMLRIVLVNQDKPTGCILDRISNRFSWSRDRIPTSLRHEFL